MSVAEIIRELGGPSKVGRALNIRSQAVSLWIRAGRIPVGRVIELDSIARELGSSLRAEHMRPDVNWSALRQ
jgi:DNA-binding transcriptional regulator YdaS (Cro superfamily)